MAIARIAKVVFASFAAALGTLIVAIVVFFAIGAEDWFGRLWTERFPYVLSLVMVCWLPWMWKRLR